jgi:hypothetical protein
MVAGCSEKKETACFRVQYASATELGAAMRTNQCTGETWLLLPVIKEAGGKAWYWQPIPVWEINATTADK